METKKINASTFTPKILNLYKSEFRNRLFPSNFRLLLIGESGCGKNVLLMEMLIRPEFLDYTNLTLYSTTVNQPELVLLKSAFENGITKEGLNDIFDNQELLCKLAKKGHPSDYTPSPELLVQTYLSLIPKFDPKDQKLVQAPNKKIKVTFSNNPNDIQSCDDLPKDEKSLVIFDDVVNLKNQKLMKSYFTRGRHNNCNIIYISQSFYELDKNSIRANSNCFIFFELGKRDRILIFNDLFPFEKDMIEQKVANHWKRAPHNYIFYNKVNKRLYKDIFEEKLIKID